MKIVIIIQVRMSSTRLPGKVLMDVAGQPMLARQIQRLQNCAADEIIVATTNNGDDDPVVDLARKLDVGWFRGSEHDVLLRFVGAAHQAKADVVVRVTADCPLIDPDVTDRVVRELTDHPAECDYASNVLKRTYPRGLDVEVLYWDALVRIHRLARSQAAREHVTVLARTERPDLFLSRNVEDKDNNADLRWTVDTAADLQLVRALYEGLGLGERIVSYAETLAYVRAHSELARVNAGVETWEPRR
jgi:spore coat polysaccharide biosynthesis protein SpsF